MNDFIVYKNLLGTLTALPLHLTSSRELEMIREAGGEVVDFEHLPKEVEYPRGISLFLPGLVVAAQREPADTKA